MLKKLERLATHYSESRFGKKEIKFFRWMGIALLIVYISSKGIGVRVPIIDNGLLSLAFLLYAIAHFIRGALAFFEERRVLREVVKVRDEMFRKIGIYN